MLFQTAVHGVYCAELLGPGSFITELGCQSSSQTPTQSLNVCLNPGNMNTALGCCVHTNVHAYVYGWAQLNGGCFCLANMPIARHLLMWRLHPYFQPKAATYKPFHFHLILIDDTQIDFCHYPQLESHFEDCLLAQ